MERYDSYKDSGVEWIGEIPSHWETNRLKWVSQIENSGVWGEDDEFPNSVNVPIPTTGQLSIEGEWYYDKMNKRNLSFDEWNKYKCVEGDIVVVKSSGSSTNIITGKCGFISKEDSGKFGFSNFLMRVRPDKMIPKLVYYFLSSNLTKQRIERMVSSTTYPNLKVDEYSNSELFIPPLSEQQQIVTFLDTKTSLIDSLIEKTQRKIELLKEKRTSLINEVVTKGLNPNVEMKDSGVEWIGEIPSHWILGRIKHKSEIISKGTTPSTIGREVLDEGSIFYIKVENIKENTVDVPPICFIDKETDNLLSRSSLKENDILVVITGSTTGKVVILPKKFTPSNTNQGISFIRLKDKSDSNVKYTWFWLSSGLIQDQIKVTYTQSTQPNLSMEDLGNFLIPFPPPSEQNEIVSYLDEQTQLIDKTISIEEKRIELLKEYRQSLFSEVVTGKLKVVD